MLRRRALLRLPYVVARRPSFSAMGMCCASGQPAERAASRGDAGFEQDNVKIVNDGETGSTRLTKSFQYFIVGGGNAAGYAVRELVAQGVAGSEIGICSAEAVPPYERPALTKAYLHPPSAKVRARLPGFHTCVGGGGERQTSEWYAEKGIKFVVGPAKSVDLAAQTVTAKDSDVRYGKLILATGCRPLRVAQFGVKGDDLKNVAYIREESDAASLVQSLESLAGGGRAVVVGGGYIGLECAAALVGWGVDTTIVLSGTRCMPRLFNSELGDWFERQLTARGIKFTKGAAASEFLGENGKVTTVKLKTGESLPCDVVVVGVGSVPNTEYCTGLTMEAGGFLVDPMLQTSNPNVFAIGDVCAFPSKYGGVGRCEHVDHARKSAAQAVKAAMGLSPEPYVYLPYFYSRIFEYTPEPIVFNFFGDQSGECLTEAQGDKSIRAIWKKEGKAVGVLMMGSPGPSPEDAEKMKAMALSPVPADTVAQAFELGKF